MTLLKQGLQKLPKTKNNSPSFIGAMHKQYKAAALPASLWVVFWSQFLSSVTVNARPVEQLIMYFKPLTILLEE